VDAGEEATDRGMVLGWLYAYFAVTQVRPYDDSTLVDFSPFVEDGKVYMFLPGLRKWLGLTQGEKLSGKSMGHLLRMAGAEPVTKNFTVRDRKTSRSLWVLGPELHGLLEGTIQITGEEE
jgi:hypothetical protein